MACQGPVIQGGPQVLWTDGATALYHPITGPLESAQVAAVRPTTEVGARTGTILVDLVARYSKDGVTRDSWFLVSGFTQLSANGISQLASWLDLTTGQSVWRYVQLGFKASVASGTANQLCAIGWRFDTQAP